MPNTSATGGYLSPTVDTPPLTGDDLENLIQSVVAGISGLPSSYVRPAWQPIPPRQPESTTDWCAVSVMSIEEDDGPNIAHDGSGDGKDNLARHEVIQCLATFYGPNAMHYAAKTRDGLSIPQNIEALLPNDMSFVEAGHIRAIPEFFNQQWIKRFDLDLVFRRKVSRAYPVLNILSAEVDIQPEEHSTIVTEI